MERFVSIAFRYRQPVFQTRWIRSIHISDNRIDIPAFGFLLLRRDIENYPYGEEVKYIFDVNFLLSQFVPDRRDGFCAAFYLEFPFPMNERKEERPYQRI